ncbi:MAG: hypothetical protein N7Q72_06770, partial [Spiroplasma sp. Tabriz.8]|nr:hypothetical protein [Spiroplasma sp. Tabriz.8]
PPWNERSIKRNKRGYTIRIRKILTKNNNNNNNNNKNQNKFYESQRQFLWNWLLEEWNESKAFHFLHILKLQK